MKRQLYTPQAAREQQRRIRRKKRQLAAATAAVLALLAAVCLLQDRRTQTAAAVINGLASAAYLSYLLYFFSYSLKKEKAYGRLVERLLQGGGACVRGTVTDCALREESLEPVYRVELEPEDGKGRRQYSLSPRTGFDAGPLVGRQAALYVCMGHVVGVEADG